MALSYNIGHKNIAKIGDRTFKFRPWTTKDEKDYLIATEAEEDITDIMLFDILIRPCLEEQEVTLSVNEQKMLLIEIRKKSLGGTFPMKYTCGECKKVNDLDVKFDNIISFSPDNFSTVTIDDVTFVFGEIPSENLKARLDGIESNTEFSFVDFCLHIREIEIGGELNDTFTFEELYEFVESLPTHIFNGAFVQFQEMKSTLKFELKTYCLMCNEENIINMDSIPNFLWE